VSESDVLTEMCNEEFAEGVIEDLEDIRQSTTRKIILPLALVSLAQLGTPSACLFNSLETLVSGSQPYFELFPFAIVFSEFTGRFGFGCHDMIIAFLEIGQLSL